MGTSLQPAAPFWHFAQTSGQSLHDSHHSLLPIALDMLCNESTQIYIVMYAAMYSHAGVHKPSHTGLMHFGYSIIVFLLIIIIAVNHLM